MEMNILNEEIMAIKHTLAHLNKGMVLEPDPSKKARMKQSIKELNGLLTEKLNQCEDYKG